MKFPEHLYLLAWLGSFLTTLILMPWIRRWCIRAGHVDHPGHRKIHEEPIPLAGGYAVLAGLLLPVILGMALLLSARTGAPWATPLLHGLSARWPQLAAILGGAIAMVALGAVDDRRNLSPSIKFGGQCLIALLVAASGIRITLFWDNFLFQYAITLLWILTLVNALNFMDNMNGLCAGLGVLGTAWLGLAAAAAGQYLVTLLALLVTGALSGFLPYNYPRARAFLGDAGSHLVGYWLAVLAILPHFYTEAEPNRWAVLRPLLVLAVPLFDLVSVVWIRWRLGKPFYVGDTNHLSHRLVRRGFSRERTVALLWLAAALAGALSFSL